MNTTSRVYIVATDITDHCDVYSVHTDLDEAEQAISSLRPGIAGLGMLTGDYCPVEGERIHVDRVNWL